MPLPLARKSQHNGLAGISQGLAALRDFSLAYVGSGSKARIALNAIESRCVRSAFPIAAVNTAETNRRVVPLAEVVPPHLPGLD
jgi:hypothetical protein